MIIIHSFFSIDQGCKGALDILKDLFPFFIRKKGIGDSRVFIINRKRILIGLPYFKVGRVDRDLQHFIEVQFIKILHEIHLDSERGSAIFCVKLRSIFRRSVAVDVYGYFFIKMFFERIES